MECVRTLCKSANVIARQETWLLPHGTQVLGDSAARGSRRWISRLECYEADLTEGQCDVNGAVRK